MTTSVLCSWTLWVRTGYKRRWLSSTPWYLGLSREDTKAWVTPWPVVSLLTYLMVDAGCQQELPHVVSLPVLVWASSPHGSWAPRTKHPKRARGEACLSICQAQSHFCCSHSPHAPGFKGKECRHYFLMGEVSVIP